MDMKLLSATGTNLVLRPLSGMCTAGQTKWQLIHSRIPTKTRKNFSYFTARNISGNSELVNYHARFLEQTRKQMMLTACNVVPHFERYAILFEGYCVL